MWNFLRWCWLSDTDFPQAREERKRVTRRTRWRKRCKSDEQQCAKGCRKGNGGKQLRALLQVYSGFSRAEVYCRWFNRMGCASAVLSPRGVIETTMYSSSLLLEAGLSELGIRNSILFFARRNCAHSPTGKSAACFEFLGRMR